LSFTRTGSGGFGVLALADVFTEQSGHLWLIKVRDVESGIQALMVRADSDADVDRVEALAHR
jgi:hypothetical protein